MTCSLCVCADFLWQGDHHHAVWLLRAAGGTAQTLGGTGARLTGNCHWEGLVHVSQVTVTGRDWCTSHR